MITPLLSVVIEATYFVPLPLATSQPQSPAAGNVDLVVLWMVSVMLVRQDEAASTISDTLARTV